MEKTDDVQIPIVKVKFDSSKEHKSLHGYEKNTKEIINWALKEVTTYGLTVSDLSCFSTGEVILALVHRLSPSIIDYNGFDKTDPVSTLTTAFLLAEGELKIPIFLTPAEVIGNKDPRALLMYLNLFKVKMEESNRPPLQIIKNELGQLTQMVTDCASTVNYAHEQLLLNCSRLNCLEKLPTNYPGEEIEYFKQRATLMDEQVKHCFKIVEDLELKNDLLFEENKILNEKINALKYSLNEEQFGKKKAEEMLGIEQKILALGNLLDPDGPNTVDYYIKKYAKETELVK